MKKWLKMMTGILIPLMIIMAGAVQVQAAWDGTAAIGFSLGSGTKSSPYVIKTEKQLAYFAEQLNEGNTFEGEYVKLSADLDMTGGVWSVSKPFQGTFLGNNHTIVMNATFLSSIGSGGTVDWLNLEATETLGGALLTSVNAGTIQNCRVRGDVTVEGGHSSLLCNNNLGTVINSCGFGSLYGSGDDSDCYVGWIAQSTGTVKNCYTIMSLSGSAPGKYNTLYKGGIVARGSFENCYTGDEVLADDNDFVDLLNQSVGIPGYIWAMDEDDENDGYPVIISCLSAETSLAESSDVMFAFHEDSLTTSIDCTESGCTIYYTLDGTDPRTSSSRKTYGSPITLNKDSVITTVAYKSGDYSTPKKQYAIQLLGEGTEEEPYEIESKLDLYAIRFEPDAYYVLTEDLDFSDDEYVHNGIEVDKWESIPSFSGTLDGQRHSITGLSSVTGGLVDGNDGTIQNLRLLNHSLHGEGATGAVANYNDGTITRCYVSGNLIGKTLYSGVGGIAGENDGEITYCSTSGRVSTDGEVSYYHAYAGGIAGNNSGGYIKSCYSDVNIYYDYTSHDMGGSAGGMAGYGGSVYDCRFDGSITIYSYYAFFGVGIAGVSSNYENVSSYRCYDGGATFGTVNTGCREFFARETYLYKTTNSGLDRMEQYFSAYDFEDVWMITEDGPMPQGIMNADGNYYTKESYTAPGIAKDGETVCYVNGTYKTVTFVLPASGVVMGTHGENLTWALYEDGKLVINGTGEMAGDSNWDFPWYYDSVSDQVISDQITSIEIGKGVTTIAPYAFYKSGATSITIPDTVTSIGNYAFDRSNLTEITIPASVTSMGYGVFYYLTNPTVTFEGDAPVFEGDTFYGTTATAYYPADNTTWTKDVLQNYGGSVTWIRNGECSHKSSWCEMKDAISAGCTTVGYTGDKYCTLCGEMVKAGSIIEPLGHKEKSYTAQEPTCTEVGWDAYVTCTRCDYSTYVEKSALGHDEVSHEAKAPTCTESGWEAYATCTRCDYSTYEEKTALGHDEVSHEAKAPTCTESGWEAYVTCTRCDYSTYAEKGALGHDEVSHEAKAPTCAEVGWDAYVTCTRCDYTTYVEKDKLKHNEVSYAAKAPTCTEAGWDAYKECSNCDYSTYTVKAALGHDEVKHKAKAPTCTEVGWEAYVTCTRCDYSTYAEKGALGHDEVSHEAKAPTCVEAGWEAYVSCTRCDESNYKEIAATGKHSYTNFVSDNNATCQKDGTETAACDYGCGETSVRTATESKLPHKYNLEGVCSMCGAAKEILPFHFEVSKEKGLAGKEVELKIDMAGNPGIIAACMGISYDADKLTLLEVSDTGLLNDSMFSKDLNANPYLLRWEDSMAKENNTQTGSIAVLKFQINENCEPGRIPVYLELSEGEIYNTDLDLIPASSINGYIDVIEYISGDANSDMIVNSIDVTLLRRYLAKWENVQINEDAMDVNDDTKVNSLDVTILRRYLAKWENVSLMAVETDEPHKAQSAEDGAMRFSVSDVSGVAGEEVKVKISMNNNPGIIAACMELAYDNEKLELLKVEDGGILNDYTFSQTLDANPYVLRWEDSLAAVNNTEDGVIATLTFRILEDCEPGSAALELFVNTGEVYNANLNAVAFEVEQGTVTIEKEKSVIYDAATDVLTLKKLPEGTENVYIVAYNDGQMTGIISGALGDNEISSLVAKADEIKVFYLNNDYVPVINAFSIGKF